MSREKTQSSRKIFRKSLPFEDEGTANEYESEINTNISGEGGVKRKEDEGTSGAGQNRLEGAAAAARPDTSAVEATLRF